MRFPGGDVGLAEWTHKQYDLLEKAIQSGRRIAAFRRGTEYVVVPTRLRLISGREAVEATHPTTGDQITLYLDEMDSFEVVK
jgi:hypothetical protein